MEQHLALYRKYRPYYFKDVVGQDHIVNTLLGQIKSGNISHAYLFTGTRGTGKTSCAKIFARAINCIDSINGDVCGKCENCKKNDNNIDIVEIDAASNNGVDEIRSLKEKINYMPVNGKYKVYIIDEVHMLSINAFNALLKTLEEPPKHVVFILATTEVYKLPLTILSRVMRFDFKLISKIDLEKKIKEILDLEKIDYDNEAISYLATLGAGSCRDAISLTDYMVSFSKGKITYEKVIEGLGNSSEDILINLTDSINNNDLSTIFNTINQLYLDGKNFINICRDLISHFRNLLVIKSCKNANHLLDKPQDIYDKLLNQANSISSDALLSYMKLFMKTENELKYALNSKNLFEITCINCLSKFNNIQKNTEELINDNNNKNKISNSSDPATLNKNTSLVKKVWGELVTKLKEKNLIVLYSACGEINNIDISGNNLIVNCMNETSYLCLSKQINKEKIIECLRELEYNYNILIKSGHQEIITDEKINKLNNIFDGDIIIE